MTKQKENTIQEAVYNELKRGIMTLRLMPGTAMSTQEMATRLKVSRTPVREAFLRLQREGLVESIPQRETMVSRIDLHRVNQECFIRHSLEEAVLGAFIAQSGPKDFESLRENIAEQREICRREDYAEFVACDGRFHKVFFDVAEQTLAWDLIASTSGHYNRIRILTIRNENLMQDIISQHEDLVCLLEENRVEEVRTLLFHHLRGVNFENTMLGEQYPDYFVQGNEPPGFCIGTL